MSRDYMKALLEERNRANKAARDIVDAALAEGRALSAEDNEAIARADADFEAKNAMIDELRKIEAREAEVRAAVAEAPEARPESRTVHADGDYDKVRALLSGELRSFEFERRDVTKAATGAPVPTDFYGRVWEVARAVGPMLQVGTTINSATGAPLQLPRTNAYSTGSVTAEGGTFGESDPTFLAFTTLTAFKESVRFDVTDEMVEDSGVDLLGYFATNIGQAIGYVTNNHLTLGTGTDQPTGIVTSAGSAITTAGTAVIAYNDVVNLVYSLDGAVRAMPGFGIMASTSALSAIRKIQDGGGAYVWQPSLQLGEPDRVLGYRLWENPHMASVASSNKAVIAGDFSSFVVRQVGGLRIKSSDDFQFDKGIRTFRAELRIDSALPQTSHVKYLKVL
jgi:HK97 family phage major capsid protein